ncbi:MAG: metallophosphoesterase [Candidatus Gastranaerophilales bacterium]|nr:metallophosphoesterase [Candidatus Gastranaerophilales bacterium]
MNLKNLYKILLVFGALFITNSAFADFSFNDIELNFAQISDTHISDSPDTTYKLLSHSKELLNSAIEDVNNIHNLDFVVFTGDMVNEPTKKNYRDFFVSLNKLNHPALLLFGNHDGYELNNSEDFLTKDLVYAIIEKSNPYQRFASSGENSSKGSTGYFAFSPNKGYRVIVLDTTTGSENSSNGFLPDEQLIFLDKELSSNPDDVIIIFQHHPVVEPFKSADHKLLNANAYLDVLKKYEKMPVAIFAGHYHCTKIIRKGNVIHVASPSLVTYPNAFRTVSVTNYNDRVIFSFKFHETKLTELQEASKQGVIASALFYGTSSDRNGQVMIRKGYVPKEKLTKDEIKSAKLEAKREKEAQKAEKKAAKKAKKEAKIDN